ncbi:MAG: c-type cytochrome domain-containing protein [Planctomycetota bacterium]
MIRPIQFALSATIVMWLGIGRGSGTSVCAQEISAAQRQGLIEARDLVGKTALEYRDRKFSQAGESLTQSLQGLETVLRSMDASSRAQTIRDMKKLLERMETAHAMLQLEGVRLPPIRIGDGTNWADEVVVLAANTSVQKSETSDSIASDAPVAAGPMEASPSTMNAPENSAGKPGVGSTNDAERLVSFTQDIAPILLKNCNGCHLDAQRVRGGLRMDSFADLVRGGDSGDVFESGDASGSLLLQRVRGEGGDRMPGGGRPALSADSIELMARWIEQGARYDGASDKLPLATAQQLAWAAKATPEERNARRANATAELLRLVVGSRETASEDSIAFSVFAVGDVTSDQLKRVGEVADEQLEDVQKRIAGSKSLEEYFQGRATIFVAQKRFQYGEFVQMVEGRRVPDAWTGHFRDDGVNPYVVLLINQDSSEAELRERLLAPLFGLAMATRGGDVPDWVSFGIGEAMANEKGRSLDRRAKAEIQNAAAEAASAAKDAKQFFENRLPADQADALSVAIAGQMIEGPRRRSFLSLLRMLDEGADFSKAFASAYRMTTDEFVDAYLKWSQQRAGIR